MRRFAAIAAATVACASLHAQDATAAARRAGVEAIYPVMMSAVAAKDFVQARALCEQAIAWEPQSPVHRYNLACIEAQSGEARRSQALDALEAAAKLGFNDANSAKADDDLASLRNDPRFAAALRVMAINGGAVLAPAPAAEVPPTAPAPARAPKVEVAPAPASATGAAAAAEKPAAAVVKDGVPVGLYFMTRFWSFNGSLEKKAWYFAADGSVYEGLEHGFSKDDLAAHASRKGAAKSVGGKLEITWAGGKKSASAVEQNGRSFMWDGGIFTPVGPFARAADAAGVYEGGESLSTGGSRAVVSKRLELRADGTFVWGGVSFIGATSQASHVSASSTGASEGRWELSGYSLVLTEANGTVLRRIVFPYDDEKTPTKPDWMFFGGLLYKRAP